VVECVASEVIVGISRRTSNGELLVVDGDLFQ
jgi:hypothetical protein